jgi:uncharacterized membrane protein YphA (DoxX/SURF4 family)
MSASLAMSGDPSERKNPRCGGAATLPVMAVGWTAMRVWLGIMWIQAGDAKLWGSENAGLHNDGAVAEWVIGIALVLGLFTRLAAVGSLLLLFPYVMSGTASVCAFYALFAVVPADLLAHRELARR